MKKTDKQRRVLMRTRSLIPLLLVLAAIPACSRRTDSSAPAQGGSPGQRATSEDGSMGVSEEKKGGDRYAPPSELPTGAPTTTASAPSRRTAPLPGLSSTCGVRTTDWCPSPAGDPCGGHKDVVSCRADPACKGMFYRGESAVVCMDDGHGFPSNCPTVGCISR
ncbi:MAG TPA: hypothetical protein VF316_02665 [Polyangiaceae bacterium]